MIRTIVAPLDGSVLAEQTLPLAREIAARARATLHLVTVPEPQHLSAAEAAGAYLADVARHLDLDAIETAVLHGVVADAIGDYAEARNADLLVVATHGAGGVTRLWLGSVTDRLVRTSRTPVLALRPRDEEAPPPRSAPAIRHVLLPLDGSEMAENVLPHACDLARVLDASCTLLRMVPPPFGFDSPYRPASVEVDPRAIAIKTAEAEQYLATVRDRMQAKDCPVTAVETITAPSEARSILDYAMSHRADLIALATHGRGGVARALLGSVADKVLRGADVPVLVLAAEN